MPELPEVETVARQLRPLLCGRAVTALELFDPRLDAVDPSQVAGRRIDAVCRSGKEVVVRFGERPYLWLVVHLRMTGRLLWSEVALPSAHLRAQLSLVGGGYVGFVDPRRFGTLMLHWGDEPPRPRGIDPSDASFSLAALREQLARSSPRQALKPWLLRQDRLVGLGNIYAAEIAHRARLHPARAIASLTARELGRLHRGIVEVLAAAVAHCGTTFSDFQTVSGSVGSYQQYLRVYGREGEPCLACGAAVAKLVQQQRSSFFCPTCQTLS